MTYRSHGVGVYRATERHICRSNRFHRRDGTTVGVLALHGSGNDATFVDTFPPAVELARRGFTVLGVDAGGLTTWGNDTALAAVNDARTFLQGTLAAKAGKIVLLGGSMGSVLALNWLRANPTAVYCASLGLPIADVEDVRANNRGGAQAAIETAYTNNAGWQTARPTHNPAEYTADLIAADVPIRFDYSTDDTIGLPALTLDLADTLGDLATVDDYGAAGHTYTGLDATTAANWVEANL